MQDGFFEESETLKLFRFVIVSIKLIMDKGYRLEASCWETSPRRQRTSYVRSIYILCLRGKQYSRTPEVFFTITMLKISRKSYTKYLWLGAFLL